jgi:hypothetical protein
MIEAISNTYYGKELKRTDSSSDEDENISKNNSEINSSSDSDIQDDDITKKLRWNPPKEHGLSNSEPIIPPYYLGSSSFVNIDYYDIIVDDIRNMRKLNSYQMKYIKEELDEHRKNHLFDIFNDILDSVGSWF